MCNAIENFKLSSRWNCEVFHNQSVFSFIMSHSNFQLLYRFSMHQNHFFFFSINNEIMLVVDFQKLFSRQAEVKTAFRCRVCSFSHLLICPKLLLFSFGAAKSEGKWFHASMGPAKCCSADIHCWKSSRRNQNHCGCFCILLREEFPQELIMLIEPAASQFTLGMWQHSWFGLKCRAAGGWANKLQNVFV